MSQRTTNRSISGNESMKSPNEQLSLRVIMFEMKGPMMCVLAVVAAGALPHPMSAQEGYAEGIVHGPKAGFNISAPEGWVVDNESGKGQDLPCVLYPKGSSWADAKTGMYAKVAGPQWEGVDAFVAWAIEGMKEKHGIP